MGNTIKSRKNPFKRKGPGQSCQCTRRAPENLSPKGQAPFAFLNEVFHPQPTVLLPVCDKPFGQEYLDGKVWWTHPEGDVRIDALANIDYLSQAVKAYCNIHEAEFQFEKSDNPIGDLHKLYTLAVAAKPERNELALDYHADRNMVILREFAQCDYDYSTIFYLQVSFVETMPEELRPIVKMMLGEIINSFDFELPDTNMDMSFALGLWDEGYMLEEMKENSPEEYEELKDIIVSYTSGDIHKLIKECSIGFTHDYDFVTEIKKFKQKYLGTRAGKFLDLLEEGIKICSEDSWQSYTLTPDHCLIEALNTYGEDVLLSPERLFPVVYDAMDEIVERALDNVNCDASMCEIGFQDHRELTPTITEAFVPSDFLKRWCDWYNRLFNLIECKDERNDNIAQ